LFSARCISAPTRESIMQAKSQLMRGSRSASSLLLPAGARRGLATARTPSRGIADAMRVQAFEEIPKLGGPACWHSSDLVKSEWWGKRLTDENLTQLHEATMSAMGSGLEYEGDVPLGVGKHNFPLAPETATMLAAMSEEIENGRGAAMLDGIRVDDYSLRELGVMYSGICAHVGHIVNQSSAGLRSKSRGYGLPIGHVKAEMRGKTPLEGKQSNNYFRLHTDRCDLISLLSVRTASRGGMSRLASAVAIHDAMIDHAPDLVPCLYQPIERIWEGGAGVIALPIWAVHPETGQFTTQISPSYIENAQFVNGVRRLTPDEIEAIDLVEEIGLEIGHEFLQQPGQVTFINNHLVYHGRTAWKFSDADDVANDASNERDNIDNGRLLLRVWVSPYNSRELPDTPEFNEMWGTVRGGEPRGGLEPAVRAGIKEKPPELVEAYVSGRADYYGMYRRKFDGEDVNL